MPKRWTCMRCGRLLTSRGTYCTACSRGGRARNTRSWQALAGLVRERDGHACVRCGEPCPHPRHHDVNHRVKRRRGGSDELRNLETLCRKCHKLADREARVAG